ncbi:MAG: zinc-ribbon domain-containing protein [Clostridia bacterium]|nr:zinc-ribbon domain-containing protein [Clostridia bacterium]
MFCTSCGKEISDKAVICVHCSAPVTGAKAVDFFNLKP